jgi:CcmD family protein
MKTAAFRQRAAALAVVVLMAVFAVAPLVAQAGSQPAGQSQPADAQGGFVPVKDLPPQEQIPAAPLVMAAYAFVWVALLVYVWTVWRRLARVEHEVHELSARLASREGSRG